MKRLENRIPRLGMLQISVKPGLPAIQLMAAAITKKIRAGAGLMSLEHFPGPDRRLEPAFVHPAGRGLARLSGRGRAPRRG